MNKISKDKRDRLVLVGVLTAMIMGMLWAFVISPQRDNLVAMEGKTAKLHELLKSADATAKSGPSVETNLASRLNALRQRESEMAPPPEGDPYAWMLGIIKEFSQGRLLDCRLDKPEYEHSELLPVSNYQFAIFHFKGVGFYSAIGKFIADFENTYRLFEIRGVNIGPAPATTSRPTPLPGDEELLMVEFTIVTPLRPSDNQPVTP